MKDALIALGMGGPESVETIRPFLFNLFCDREIINFHIGDFPQRILANIISSKRSKKIAKDYLKMGFNGASPQNVHTRELLGKLPPLYKAKTGRDLDTFSAMCYFHPLIHEAVEDMSREGYERLIILPLFPQYAYVTTGACLSKLNKHVNIFYRYFKEIITIPYWYDDKKYIDITVRRIKEAAGKIGKDIKDCNILFSAHSLPEHYLNLGDPYVKQIQDHSKILAEKAGAVNYTISYQSKFGPVKWVGPSTMATLEEMKNKRTDNIIVVPLAFISDHIETLIELDEQLLPAIRASGLKIERAQSLNSDDDFAEAIAGIIARSK